MMSTECACDSCHYYGGYFAPDNSYICNSPENGELMKSKRWCGSNESPRDRCMHYVERRGL